MLTVLPHYRNLSPYGKTVTLGDRISVARKHAGLNQSAVADALGLGSGSRVSDWETGKTSPPARKLMAMPSLFACSGHWLLTGEGPMTGPSNEDALRLTVIRRIAAGEVSDYELLNANA